MPTPPRNPTIVREFPQASNDFLRFQVGHADTRMGYKCWKDTSGEYHEKAIGMVPVFRLIGFGSTLEKAERMAAKKIR